tara:strand:- start:95 stop:535 length:441 start_codon:yes stop_codon:yes gene_type:complete
MSDTNSSAQIIKLSKHIKERYEQIEKIDQLHMKITKQREDLVKSMIDDLTAIQKLSYDEVKKSNESTQRLFDESVSRPINQLITEIIRRLKSSIHYQENNLSFGQVHEQMVETLSRVKGFKAYLSEIQKGQLDKLFDLPHAHKDSI